jgi:hypothetical protein
MTPSDHTEPQRCDCDCHRDQRIKHIMACCEICDRCKTGFVAGLAKHRETCTGRP